jgi:hypothetical protein
MTAAISNVGVADGGTVGVLDGLGVFVENLRVGVRVDVETGLAVSVIVGNAGEDRFCRQKKSTE